MSTPLWDTLHLRFATSIRDQVSSASVDGLELTVSDRDAYLNYAYTKYISLIALYNPQAINRILSDICVNRTLSLSGGSNTLPSDFGYYVNASSSTAIVTKPDNQDWLSIKDSSTLQNPASSTNMYINISGFTLTYVPTISVSLDFTYIAKPISITEGGSNDIILGANHWDIILQFARAQYFRDKNEFQVAQSIENDAIALSPFKIGEVKQ